MLAKKDKNPRVIFEDSGITENRYICDGYHRICKAILENKTEIDAIRIQKMPKPDGYEERS